MNDTQNNSSHADIPIETHLEVPTHLGNSVSPQEITSNGHDNTHEEPSYMMHSRRMLTGNDVSRDLEHVDIPDETHLEDQSHLGDNSLNKAAVLKDQDNSQKESSFIIDSNRMLTANDEDRDASPHKLPADNPLKISAPISSSVALKEASYNHDDSHKEPSYMMHSRRMLTGKDVSRDLSHVELPDDPPMDEQIQSENKSSPQDVVLNDLYSTPREPSYMMHSRRMLTGHDVDHNISNMQIPDDTHLDVPSHLGGSIHQEADLHYPETNREPSFMMHSRRMLTGNDIDLAKGGRQAESLDKLDKIEKVIEVPLITEARPVTLTFKDLSYSVRIKNKVKRSKNEPKFIQKEILKGISGVCKAGQLTAIMGASGAGKTTLLNILSCRVPGKDVKGTYCANGQQYDAGKFSKFAGYVMQNDILLQTMTPRETFQFTASLRLHGTKEQKNLKVKQLLHELKLERAADTLIGGTFHKGISGGERKRTSIGVELITDPSLLFLDEPTSGLDSFTAFILISLLKKLAVKDGKNIIFTIHQPSSDIFFMFDNLMLLAKGKFIYQGLANLAVNYFGSIGYQCPEHYNPADYFIEITFAQDDHRDEDKFMLMYEKYDATMKPKIEAEIRESKREELHLAQKVNGFIYSAGVIAKRSGLNILRNPLLLKGRLFQTAFITFLMCALFFQITSEMDGTDLNSPGNKQVIYDITGSLFFFTISLFMSSAMTVVLTFPAERAVFLREYSANMYSISAYYVGRSSTEIPLAILLPVLQSLVSYYIIGYNHASVAKLFIFMLIMTSISLAGNATGLLVGSIFSDVKVATNIVPAIILPWTLFTGVYINISSIHAWLRWIQYTSPFRYALEALLWNQYTDFQLGTDQLAYYNYNLGLWLSWGLLFALGLIMRFFALAALKLLVKRLQ